MATAHFETVFNPTAKRGDPIKYKCMEKNCNAILRSFELDKHAQVFHDADHVEMFYRSY